MFWLFSCFAKQTHSPFVQNNFPFYLWQNNIQRVNWHCLWCSSSLCLKLRFQWKIQSFDTSPAPCTKRGVYVAPVWRVLHGYSILCTRSSLPKWPQQWEGTDCSCRYWSRWGNLDARGIRQTSGAVLLFAWCLVPLWQTIQTSTPGQKRKTPIC